jgi:hypothetical protein
MKTIEIKIKPNPEDTDLLNGMMNKAVAAALSKIKQIEEAIADIRDPETKEGAKVTWEPVSDGVKVSIKGSDFVKAEAERRISALPNQRLL